MNLGTSLTYIAILLDNYIIDVTKFGGVIAQDRSLVNIGDFIALKKEDKLVSFIMIILVLLTR